MEDNNTTIEDMKKIYKRTSDKPKNKKVVYTCISGKYDTLMDPIYVNDDFDYICYTDQPFKSNIWEIRPIPEELNDLSTDDKTTLVSAINELKSNMDNLNASINGQLAEASNTINDIIDLL